MANFNWKTLLAVAVAAYVGYSQRDKIKSFIERKDSEYVHYNVGSTRVQDYGSLEDPVSIEYKSMGRAAGQTASQANEAVLAMSVGAVGQNYNGRSFGL